MKTTKLVLTLVFAAAAIIGTAKANDLKIVAVTNGHGQTTYLYRQEPPTVAVFVGGRGINGAPAAKPELRATTWQNGHGQYITLYRQVSK